MILVYNANLVSVQRYCYEILHFMLGMKLNKVHLKSNNTFIMLSSCLSNLQLYNRFLDCGENNRSNNQSEMSVKSHFTISYMYICHKI